jgi:hypothetical protein
MNAQAWQPQVFISPVAYFLSTEILPIPEKYEKLIKARLMGTAMLSLSRE